jgi:hypothetical protein
LAITKIYDNIIPMMVKYGTLLLRRNYIFYLFLVIFVFLPSTLFSQVLVLGDIDILLNGYSILQETISELNDRNDEAMKGYQNKIEAFTLEYMARIIETAVEEERIINDGEFHILKRGYQRILKIDVPIELNDTFVKMGWNDNGHKKFITIAFGLAALLIQDMEEYESAGVELLLNLFDKSDISMIEKRMSELEGL